MLATVHLIIASTTGLLVLYSDHEAYKWFSGKVDTMLANRIKVIHRTVSFGLALLLITGGLLYAQAAPAYLSLPVFIVKMSMVLALIVNSYFIERLSTVACERNFKSLSHPERIPLLVCGAISLACWATAFICGLAIANTWFI
jgi:hypothetical protein